MADLALAKAFIDIGYRGFDKIDSMMNKAATDIKKGLAPINELFKKSAQLITGFGGTASPIAIRTLSQSFDVLRASMGTAFTVPLLQISKSIQDLTKWVQGLDKETTSNIARWILTGTVLLGSVVIIGKLIGTLASLWNTLKFFALNPLAVSFMAAAAAATLLLTKLDLLDGKVKKMAEEHERIKSGKVTERDIEKSGVGQDLMEIKNPAERHNAARASANAIAEEIRKINASQKGIMGMGGDIVAEKLGLNPFGKLDKSGKSDTTRGQEKIASLMRDHAVAMAIANEGDKPIVPAKVSDVKGDRLKLANPQQGGGSGMGIGTLEGQFSKFQTQVLGQSSLDQQMLEIQKKNQQIAEQEAADIQGIHMGLQQFLPNFAQ